MTQIRSFKQLFRLGNHHLHNPLQGTIPRLLLNDRRKITWSNVLHLRIIGNITLFPIQTEKSQHEILEDHILLIPWQRLHGLVSEAKQLLEGSDLSIKEIANQLNFPTQSFFGKYFKQYVGISPKEYRKDKLRIRNGI